MMNNRLKELLEEKKYKEIHSLLAKYNPVDMAELLMELDETQLAVVFRMIDKDKAAEVFSYMDDNQRQALLRCFTGQEISHILETMYTDDAVDFLEDMPANVVTKLLEHVSGDTRADINKLLQYPEDSTGSIMTVEYVELSPDMTVEQALLKIRRVGIDSETTEDMHKMAAMAAGEDSYLKTSVLRHARNRIVWLLILMFSATITGAIITHYEDAFNAIPLLVAFIPMLMDTGGNCGSQSSTLIIRGLAVDELHFSDFFTIVWKEFRVSLVVGAALAVANGIRIWLVYHNASLAIVVGGSLLATIIVAKLVGCMLPVFAKQMKLDPAIMAAPLITTIVDTCSIMIFFKIATLVFHLA